MVKKSENLKKSQKISKNHFFSFLFITFFFAEKRKENAILLVLPIEEISLQQELSSPARFRIQGGYPERDGEEEEEGEEGNPCV